MCVVGFAVGRFLVINVSVKISFCFVVVFFLPTTAQHLLPLLSPTAFDDAAVDKYFYINELNKHRKKNLKMLIKIYVRLLFKKISFFLYCVVK